jgi:hypothetical protein
MMAKAVRQVCPIALAGGEIEHEALLIDSGVDLAAVEDVSMAACPTRLLPSTNGWF